MRGKKILLVTMFFFIALCLAVTGYALGQVSASNRSVSVTSGYVDSSGFHASYNGSGRIGGNKKAEKSMAAGSTFCYILSGVGAVGGVITLFAWRKDT